MPSQNPGACAPRFRFMQVLIFGDLGMGCRNLFLEISMISGCLRVRSPTFMFRCGHYRSQAPWISFKTCCSDMSRPASQNHSCLRPQAPRDLLSCGLRPQGFYGDKILGLTLPCMSNPYQHPITPGLSQKQLPGSLFVQEVRWVVFGETRISYQKIQVTSPELDDKWWALQLE